MTIKEIALSYLNKGFSIIPLKSPTMVSSQLPPDEFIRHCKMPLISWKEFQTRHPTPQEVSDWFTKWPDANIGIVTGKISNLVVFDLDSKDAERYAEDEGGFPDTVKAYTGKGNHIYVRYPGFAVNSRVNKDLEIDIRADGGYTVAPGSIHGSGRQYEWAEGFSPFQIDPAPCEPWMEEYLKTATRDAPKSDNGKKAVKTPENPNAASKAAGEGVYADILKNGAQAGNRNDTVAKLAGHLFGRGLDEDEVWEILKSWNAGKNNPPLGQNELHRTFQSIRNLEGANGKKEDKEIDVAAFLDTPKKVVAEYSESYLRLPFDIDGKLAKLQSKMNGGLVGGRLYILGGIPSSGKAGLANNTADNICLQNHPVLFFSGDDGVSELRYRSYARFSGYDIEDFNRNEVPASDVEGIAKNEHLSRINPFKYVVPRMINIEEWAG